MEYANVTCMRLHFLVTQKRRPDQYTVFFFNLGLLACLLFVEILDCLIQISLQVLVRNIPFDPDESVSEFVEHFFLVNHPDHYLTHQVFRQTYLPGYLNC